VDVLVLVLVAKNHLYRFDNDGVGVGVAVALDFEYWKTKMLLAAAVVHWSRDGMSLPKYSCYQEEKIGTTGDN
jgi:hypothetical protein